MKATKVNAGVAESNGRLLLGIWRDSLHVTCGLTACTPGSAPGPTLGNEYGKTLPYLFSGGSTKWSVSTIPSHSTYPGRTPQRYIARPPASQRSTATAPYSRESVDIAAYSTHRRVASLASASMANKLLPPSLLMAFASLRERIN